MAQPGDVDSQLCHDVRDQSVRGLGWVASRRTRRRTRRRAARTRRRCRAGRSSSTTSRRRLNLQGCGGANWSDNGTFTYTYGTNSAGDPIGAIDTHQLGTGLGGRVLFTHTEDGSNPALINTGMWTPNLPSLQYYKVKLHLPGSGRASDKRRLQRSTPAAGSRRGRSGSTRRGTPSSGSPSARSPCRTAATSSSPTTAARRINGGFGFSDFDVAFDAIAFVPQGGTPGQPIGGPPGIQDAPEGLQPRLGELWLRCAHRGRPGGHLDRLLRRHLHRPVHPRPRQGAGIHPQLRGEPSPIPTAPTAPRRPTARSAGAGTTPTT